MSCDCKKTTAERFGCETVDLDVSDLNPYASQWIQNARCCPFCGAKYPQVMETHRKRITGPLVGVYIRCYACKGRTGLVERTVQDWQPDAERDHRYQAVQQDPVTTAMELWDNRKM